ncbi:MAG: helix-turn-helix domain-containing protein [Vicinamibacteria bacterium]
MTRRDPGPLSPKALLRYQVVSLVRARLLAGEGRAAAVDAVARLDHATPAGELVRVSTRSVYRWLAQYEAGGAAALEDQAREAGAASRALPTKLLEFLATERDKDSDASIPELLRRAVHAGLLSAWRDVDRTTVFRALVRMKVATGRRKKTRDRDVRRFAYPHRMELVLADGKHFRAGAARSRRVAFFFLDDCTRLGLHVVVGTSETAALFLRGFHAVLRDYGRMGIVYLDRGPGFIATAVAEVCRRLELSLIHGESKYPEGHGKVEKFNQTVQEAVLRSLSGRPDVDDDCKALEIRLAHWLREVYNHEPHESLVRP